MFLIVGLSVLSVAFCFSFHLQPKFSDLVLNEIRFCYDKDEKLTECDIKHSHQGDNEPLIYPDVSKIFELVSHGSKTRKLAKRDYHDHSITPTALKT